jgi:hypothetical protein
MDRQRSLATSAAWPACRSELAPVRKFDDHVGRLGGQFFVTHVDDEEGEPRPQVH